MQTLKIKYSVKTDEERELVLSFIRQYSSCLHFAYNRVKEDVGEKEYTKLTESLNNIDLMSKWTVHCAYKEATQLIATNDKVVFGGKRNFIQRCKNRITKEKFQRNRLSPFYCIGDKEHHGNRFFRIQKELDSILFMPSRHIRFDLNLEYGNRKNIRKILKKLLDLQVNCRASVTFKLGLDYIYITFDEKDVFGVHRTRHIKNRVLALDMNPNYVGWSIVDWKDDNEYSIVKSGVYSLKAITDIERSLKKLKIPSTDKRRKYIGSKICHETFEISKNLVEKARHFQCEIVAVEKLDMRPSDKRKGKKYNRLCNNVWPRKKFVDNLKKRCNIAGIHFQEVVPEYSSLIGNVLFRKYGTPDMVNASFEIGRRGYEFKSQYIDKTKKISRNVVYPEMEKFAETMAKSLEEFGIEENFSSWKELYYLFKNAEMTYRVPFRGDEKWFQLKTRKSNVGISETLFSLSS